MSTPAATDNMAATLTIIPLPAFNDNYIWLIHRAEHSDTYVVDPGDATPVLHYLAANNSHLSGILLTHHHSDHTGGIARLKAAFPDVKIYGPAQESISGITSALQGNEEIFLPELNCSAKVLSVPGHTSGHIAYLLQNNLFCGDTLFSGGCGRLFEGTAEQMYRSLAQFAALDDNVKVYCAHEYTLANLAFAQTVDPNNSDIHQYLDWCQQQRQHHLPTLPSSIGLEKRINPFLRCNEHSVQAQVANHCGQKTSNSTQVFTQLRQWKDNF